MIQRLFTCTLLVLTLAGCGRDLPELVPVSGRVTFDGGPPPAAGVVHFLPLEAGGALSRRPGMGSFGPDGRFEVESFSGARGLVPGRYRVRIECLSHQPAAAPGPRRIRKGQLRARRLQTARVGHRTGPEARRRSPLRRAEEEIGFKK